MASSLIFLYLCVLILCVFFFAIGYVAGGEKKKAKLSSFRRFNPKNGSSN